MAGATRGGGEDHHESEEPDSDEDGAQAGFEGEPIFGRTAITAEDFKKIWWLLPQNRRVGKSAALIGLGVPAFYAIQRWMVPGGDVDPVNWAFLFSACAMPPALVWALWRARARWAQTAVADLRSQEGVAFRFDAEGMSIDAPGRKHTLAWATLVHCLEAPESFLVYTTPAAVMVVPKRAFSATDQARLRTLLAELVPKRPLRGVKLFALRTLVLWVVLVLAFLAIWQFLER